jgi:hypothetical protein
LYPFLQIKRETPKFQEPIQDICRINTGGQGINKKFEQEEKKGGPPIIRKKRRELKIETFNS